jgi:hypothetical protein
VHPALNIRGLRLLRPERRARNDKRRRKQLNGQ